jgi:phosphate transport system substrate-binding protein
MKKNNTILRMLSAALIMAAATAIWLAVPVPPVEAAGDAIVVIVNPSNPVENLSMGELKKLFLSDRSKWDTGKSVAPVMVTSGAPERAAFLKAVCGMSDADFGKYFVAAAFSGKSATPPKEVGSASAVKGVVASSPGAIGFVKAGDLAAGDASVKAVKIDGAAAGDAGYKLKM